MASTNKQLAERAREIGKTLGREVDTSGLNKEQLTTLVTQLSDEAGGANSTDQSPEEPTPQEPQADGEKQESEKPPEPINGADDYQGGAPPKKPPKKAPPKRGTHYVAPGHSVPSRRGPLREMEEVREEDFAPEVLRILVAKGCVKKR